VVLPQDDRVKYRLWHRRIVRNPGEVHLRAAAAAAHHGIDASTARWIDFVRIRRVRHCLHVASTNLLRDSQDAAPAIRIVTVLKYAENPDRVYNCACGLACMFELWAPGAADCGKDNRHGHAIYAYGARACACIGSNTLTSTSCGRNLLAMVFLALGLTIANLWLTSLDVDSSAVETIPRELHRESRCYSTGEYILCAASCRTTSGDPIPTISNYSSPPRSFNTGHT
jgi:hypothetical protein